MRAEREIRAEPREFGHELRRTVPAVQQEAAARESGAAQDVHQRADGLDAVDGERAVELDGERQLRAEGLLLRERIEILHPSVEPHLADTGRGVREQEAPQQVRPALRSRRDIPRVQAERDAVTRVASAEGRHVFPIRRRAAVDHRLADAVRPGLLDRGVRHLGELVMAMGVAEFHQATRTMTAAPFASTTNHLALPPRPALSPRQDEDAALAHRSADDRHRPALPAQGEGQGP